MHLLGICIEYMHVRYGAVKVKGLRYISSMKNLIDHETLKDVLHYRKKYFSY